MNIRVINGPNLNMLGRREPDVYGAMSYAELVEAIADYASQKRVSVTILQSNYEGQIVEWIQEVQTYDALIINPAAYSHTSIAILDALLCVSCPKIEVHLSDIEKREAFRRQKITARGVNAVIMGKHIKSYYLAIDQICEHIVG